MKISDALRFRIRACAIHFVVSAVVSVFLTVLVFHFWYPGAYSEISDGRTILLTIVGVDIVLGPLITFIVVNLKKSKKELVCDIFFVALIQLGALGYGMWSVYLARPIHLVFEYSRFVVVHATDIDESTIKDIDPRFQSMSLTGPTLLSLRPLTSLELMESTLLALNGLPQAAQPNLWREYDAGKAEVAKNATPLSALKMRFPERVSEIDRVVKKTGLPEDQLKTLPLLSRKKAWTVLISSESWHPVGYLDIDSF